MPIIIRRLPAYMIEAFKSTLEESLAADLILLMIDCSEEQIEDIRMRYFSCWDVLNELKVDRSKVFVIFSKSDSIPLERIDQIVSDIRIADPIVISSKTGYGIHKLKRMMASHLIKSAMAIPNSPKIGLTNVSLGQYHQ